MAFILASFDSWGLWKYLVRTSLNKWFHRSITLTSARKVCDLLCHLVHSSHPSIAGITTAVITNPYISTSLDGSPPFELMVPLSELTVRLSIVSIVVNQKDLNYSFKADIPQIRHLESSFTLIWL